MGKFEKYRPQLKPGRLIPQGQKLIFETDKPFDQIVLPVEIVDFLLLCNGEHTVGEIIEMIYHRKGNIQFKMITKTLTYLKKREFLENGDDLEIRETPDALKDFQFLTFKPFFELPVGKRIFNEGANPIMFYFIAMTSIVFAILSFQSASHSWFNLSFIRLGGSFLKGIGFLFFASSLLLSLKNFYKCLSLLFLTGRAYNFGLVFNGFALYFRVKSDSLFLVTNRLYLALFHLSVTLCYFPIVGGLYFFFPNLPHFNESMSLGFLLFLFELNPFQESELGDMLRSVFNDDTVNKMSSYLSHKPLLSLVHPLGRNRDYNLYFFFMHFTLLWSATLLYTVFTALHHHYGSFISAIKTAGISSQLIALGSASFLVTLGLVVAYNSWKVISISLFQPLSRLALDNIRRRKSHRLEFFNSNEVMNILEGLPLFSYFSKELLGMIVNRSILKVYNSKTPVILQGDEGTHLFVLLSGALQVRRRLPSGRIHIISEIHPPSIFGEIAVIEASKRTADVIALKDAIVVEIPAPMLRQIADDAQYIRALDNFRNAIAVNQFFSSAPVFRDLPETIVHLFTAKGKIENFLADQIIFKQGDIGDGFYLLLRGSVGVSVHGRPMSRIQQGGFFGEISMIADVPRTATIYALEPVQILKINRDAFWDILAQDINMAMFIESVGEMRIREDIEVLNSGRANVA